jgi:hypothetical protein
VEADELVRLAEAKLEVEGDAALARALGLGDYNAPARVRRWRRGENEPDYKATLMLLGAAGLLRDEPGSTRSHVADAADREEELFRRLELAVVRIEQALADRPATPGARPAARGG